MGSALLNRPKRLKELVMAMSATSEIPITVKVRMGTTTDKPIVHEAVAPQFHDWGAAALTLHGRYSKYLIQVNTGQ